MLSDLLGVRGCAATVIPDLNKMTLSIAYSYALHVFKDFSCCSVVLNDNHALVCLLLRSYNTLSFSLSLEALSTYDP